MSTANEIEKLNELKNAGAISEEEFEQAKTELLKQINTDSLPGEGIPAEADINMWGMFIHLSQFAGYVIPFLGFILPIVLWQIKKNESDIIDQHGKNVTNWLISAVIYGFISAILSVIIIGVPMLIALGIVGIVFPIIGGIKANNGEIWVYPVSIKFFK